jgi:TetR/AcrR family transcriptional regulator, lmrAB and yxaGH operons repressor
LPRPPSIDEEALIEKLSRVFSDVGYEGASLNQLSAATGLQKASLYYRFPRGKRQMAEEVLAAAGAWLASFVLTPLTSAAAPDARIAEVSRNLDQFYCGGRRACLLNMLSSPRIEDGPFSEQIRSAFGALIGAFDRLIRDAGYPPDAALRRASRTVMLLHGSLVLSRGLGSEAPFKAFLADLPNAIRN